VLRFTYSAQSHVGLVRDNNEDAGFAGPHLLLVADGVGGSAAGEVASATTAYVTSALMMVDDEPDPMAVLAEAVRLSNDQLRIGAERDPSRRGMSTTLVALMTYRNRSALVNVGDSRAYLARDDGLRRLTRDHTFVQDLIDDGQITREEARTHPFRTAVVNAVNGSGTPEPDLVRFDDLRIGDRVMLCSDGLSDLVPSERLASILADADLDDVTAALIAAALDAGGRDNITCIVADVEDGPEARTYGQPLGAMRDPYLIVDPAVVRPIRPA
jgi:PPM family protein phosphatase